MGDSCYPIGFICEPYVTFSKSRFACHSLFIELKYYAEIFKNHRVLDKGNKHGDETKLKTFNLKEILTGSWDFK